MTVKNDRRYFQNNPQYHMYLHPEMPSYEEQLAARDRMLGKHPNLPFLGAHFGSLEWSVDALARFLEEHPSAVVDTAARMGQLEYQSQRDWKKVRDFMLKYQDRILYGTDGGVQAPGQAASALIQMQKRWQSDWIYLASREEQSVPELDLPVKGLHLPSFCAGQNLPRECEATFSHSLDGVKDLALRAPIVSALMEVGSRPWTLPGWSAASLGFGMR